MGLDIPSIFGIFKDSSETGQGFSAQNIQLGQATVIDVAGQPTETYKVGTMVWNTANNRLYIQTDGSNELPTILFLKINEGSGTSMSDLSGNSHNATAENALGWTTEGKFTNGFDFTTYHATISDHADFDFSNNDFTIEFWIYAETLDGDHYIYDQTGAGGDRLAFYVNTNGAIRYKMQTASAEFAPNGTITTGEWIHIAITYEDNASPPASDYQTYKNGSLISSGTCNNLDFTGTSSVYIGSDTSSANHFKGIINDLKIWDDIRTEAEINRDWKESAGLAWVYLQSTA